MRYTRYRDVVQDSAGNGLSGITVTVYKTGTTNLATIYSDSAGQNTILGSVVTTSSNPAGVYYFYVAEGVYDLTMRRGSETVATDLEVQVSRATQESVSIDLVEDFWADRTGITDASDPWANAISSINPAVGGCLTVPHGTFVMDPRTMSGINGLRIEGKSMTGTILEIVGAGNGLDFLNCPWLELVNLTVKVYGTYQAVADAYGMLLGDGCSNSLIQRVRFLGFSMDGLVLEGASLESGLSGVTVQNCFFLGNGRYNFRSRFSQDFSYFNNQFGRLPGVTKAEIGAFLDNSSEGGYIDNKHWDNGIGCYSSSCNAVRVIANRFEESEQEGYSQLGGARTTFLGNHIHSNSSLTLATYDGAKFDTVTGLTVGHNKLYSFDTRRHRWGINIDEGCTNVIHTDQVAEDSGFGTGFGPIRIGGTVAATASTDIHLPVCTSGTVAPGTVYLGQNGHSATEQAVLSMPGASSTLAKIYVAAVAAPGTGETFTYQLRKNGADVTDALLTISDDETAAILSTPTPPVFADPDDYFDLKLVVSAGGATTHHRGYIDFAKR